MNLVLGGVRVKEDEEAEGAENKGRKERKEGEGFVCPREKRK
jgi:hypothetical protein